jgi:hypothetical protein
MNTSENRRIKRRPWRNENHKYIKRLGQNLNDAM